MDPRRLNDFMKIAGALGAGFGSFGTAALLIVGFLPPGKLQSTLLAIGTLFGTICAWLSGWGTRSKGTEYQDVAEAKAMAKLSMQPPPPAASLSVAPTDPPTSA